MCSKANQIENTLLGDAGMLRYFYNQCKNDEKSRAYLNKGPSKKTGDWQWQFIRINAQSFDLKFRFWTRSFLRPLPTMLTTTSASIFIWLFFDGLFLTRQCRRSPLKNPKAIATILVEVAMNMRNILRGQPKNGNMAIQNTFRSLDMTVSSQTNTEMLPIWVVVCFIFAPIDGWWFLPPCPKQLTTQTYHEQPHEAKEILSHWEGLKTRAWVSRANLMPWDFLTNPSKNRTATRCHLADAKANAKNKYNLENGWNGLRGKP